MKKDRFVYNGVLYALSLAFFLFGVSACEKAELEAVEEKTEEPVQLSGREMTKSLVDIDTTLNVPSDGFVYTVPYSNDIGRSCGCVPPIKVELVTGVLVFTFPLGGSYECRSFSLTYTVNGATYSKDDISGTDVYVSDVRIGYGQSCTGSATLTCKSSNPECAGYSGSCSQTVNFSLKEGGSGSSGGNPSSCGRYYGDVTVTVTQTGVAEINVAYPLITFNEMQVTRCEVYHENKSIYGIDLEIGKNSIQFPNGADYWLKMYNPNECSNAAEHFLRCSLWGAPGPKYVEEINNKH